MLSVMSARLTQLVPCEAIAVFELKDNFLIPIYADGQDRMLFSSLEIPLGEGLSGWVAKHKESIFNGNPAVEFGYTNDPTKYTLLHSALVVPLIGSTGLVGVLALYRSEADSFSKDHSRILSGINTKVGLSLENALRYRAMEASATTDYLTGLHNTRSLFERLHHELARCKRDRLPLTVMVCDLDGFKQVNDRFGHSAGNQILQTFATGLKELGRQYDIMARFGGDEFVLVFPEMKPETVNKKTQTLSRLAIETGRQVCGETITAVSVGVACFPEDGATPDELLTEADRRMYASKKARKRNPAALFSTEPTETPSPKEETHAIR
jgi:diguanylate cyclase (GGDEF)-like protein